MAWEPPCIGPEPPCGGPWADFVLELRRGHGDWEFELATPETTATVTLQPGTWRARVAARNEAGIQGPYSLPSDPLVIPQPDDDLPDIHEWLMLGRNSDRIVLTSRPQPQRGDTMPKDLKKTNWAEHYETTVSEVPEWSVACECGWSGDVNALVLDQPNQVCICPECHAPLMGLTVEVEAPDTDNLYERVIKLIQLADAHDVPRDKLLDMVKARMGSM